MSVLNEYLQLPGLTHAIELNAFNRMQTGFDYTVDQQAVVLTNIPKFYRFLENLDHYYAFSDDAGVYRRGEQQMQLANYLTQVCDQSKAVAATLQRIRDFYKKHSIIPHDNLTLALMLGAEEPIDVLKAIEHPAVEIIDFLSEGTGDVRLAGRNLSNYRMMVNHIDRLAGELAKKLTQWKPPKSPMAWDEIHVPQEYHQELRKILEYLNQEIFNHGINSTVRLLLPMFKNLQFDYAYPQSNRPKRNVAVEIQLIVPGTPQRYSISRRY